MLPKELRDRIWATFRPGQEINWTPSREYIDAANDAQAWIAKHFPPACAACGGSGKNSKGGPCHPCEIAGRIPRSGGGAGTAGMPAIERARRARDVRTQQR